MFFFMFFPVSFTYRIIIILSFMFSTFHLTFFFYLQSHTFQQFLQTLVTFYHRTPTVWPWCRNSTPLSEHRGSQSNAHRMTLVSKLYPFERASWQSKQPLFFSRAWEWRRSSRCSWRVTRGSKSRRRDTWGWSCFGWRARMNSRRNCWKRWTPQGSFTACQRVSRGSTS